MALLITLGLVYVGGATLGFVRSGGAKWDWEWPVRLVAQGWNKLFGKDSVFDKKEDENE